MNDDVTIAVIRKEPEAVLHDALEAWARHGGPMFIEKDPLTNSTVVTLGEGRTWIPQTEARRKYLGGISYGTFKRRHLETDDASLRIYQHPQTRLLKMLDVYRASGRLCVSQEDYGY